MADVNILWQTGTPTGTLIRKLNGGNLAPLENPLFDGTEVIFAADSFSSCALVKLNAVSDVG